MKPAAALLFLFLVAASRSEIRTVTVENFQFKDSVSNTATTTINVGDTVRWVWVSGFHTTTSDSALWNAPIDSTNPSFEFTFNTAGTFGYHCAFHFGMDAQVIVQSQGISPATVMAGPGSILTGNATSLSASDDVRVTAKPGAVLTSSTPPLQLTMTATAPAGTITSYKFKLESSATVINLSQRILLFDYTVGDYVEMDVSTPSTSDTSREVHVTTNFARFIDSTTREVKVRVTYKATGAVLVYPWNARLDHAVWTLPTS